MKIALQNYSLTKYFTFTFLFLTSSLLIFAQDINTVAKDLAGTNISKVVDYLAPQVDLTLLEKDCPTCGKQKTAAALSQFFRQNKPTDFKIKHKGNAPDGSSFLVGTLFTKNERFRTYILLKNKKIQELSFER